jgi:pyruvate kinase
MQLPKNKTRIVCTIGPASDRPEMLDALLRAGMSIARLNFSHGDFSSHQATIRRLREASERTGLRLAIMADLPGPKIRIGKLEQEPLELLPGAHFILTTEEILGNRERVAVDFPNLPTVVEPGNKLFLNDGTISLRVDRIEGNEIHCEVRAGGEIRSRKGLDLPGIDLGISAYTEQDRRCLEFALQQGVDAVSQSFVSTSEDIQALLETVSSVAGPRPLVIAKIERARALENIDAILEVADGIMVARGDLGVEIPISRMALVQKELMAKANEAGKPVITATQMLESMIEHRRPTRAEATDVANAILDGTDAVMLSAESAVGRYPLESVSMLADIAAETEIKRQQFQTERKIEPDHSPVDLIACSLNQTVTSLHPIAVMVPTRSGTMARSVARFRLPTWVTAFSADDATCQSLQFSYGIQPVRVDEEQVEWMPFACKWLAENGLSEGLAVLTQGPSPEHPAASHRMEIIDLAKQS